MRDMYEKAQVILVEVAGMAGICAYCGMFLLTVS
jgi:hypothetical protein